MIAVLNDDNSLQYNKKNQVQYVVNFAPELHEITVESKYMEQLGFAVPELARNVALQTGSGCHNRSASTIVYR